MKKARLDHIAVRVQNLEWYLAFLQDVFGMKKTESRGADPARPDQVWVGGFQLTRDIDYRPMLDQPERIWHVSIDVADLATTAKAISAYPQVRPYSDNPEQKYWFVLPDGLIIELVNR